MMNTKSKILFIAVATATLTLTGCGGSDGNDNDDYNDSANNTISFSQIGSQVDDTTNHLTAVYRIDYQLRDGERNVTYSDILGTRAEYEYYDDTHYYLLCDNYSRVVPGDEWDSFITKNLNVISNDHYQIDASNNGQNLIWDSYLEYVNISGYSVDTPNFNSLLDDLEIDGTVMPSGSECLIIAKDTTNKAYFEVPLNDDDASEVSEQTLASWVAEQPTYNNYVSHGVKNVGDDNQYKAAYAVFNSLDDNGNLMLDEDGNAVTHTDAVVMIGDTLEQANYYSEDGMVKNTDINKGPIECYRFNDTAIDYLENQILENKEIF